MVRTPFVEVRNRISDMQLNFIVCLETRIIEPFIYSKLSFYPVIN